MIGFGGCAVDNFVCNFNRQLSTVNGSFLWNCVRDAQELVDCKIMAYLRAEFFNISFYTLPLRLLFVKCVRMASKCSDRILHMAAECSLGNPDNIC